MATDDMRARIGADDGRRPDGGHIPMTLAWQFLAQRGYRPLRPGEASTYAPQTWFLRERYLQHYGFAILDDATVQVLAPYAPRRRATTLMMAMAANNRAALSSWRRSAPSPVLIAL